MKISKKQFVNKILYLRTSIDSKIQLFQPAVEIWYDKYFKFYSELEIDNIIEIIIKEKSTDFRFRHLQTLLETTKEYFGYLLHEEIKIAESLLIEAKKRHIPFSLNKYPNLNKKLPIKRAWVYVQTNSN